MKARCVTFGDFIFSSAGVCQFAILLLLLTLSWPAASIVSDSREGAPAMAALHVQAPAPLCLLPTSIIFEGFVLAPVPAFAAALVMAMV